MEIRFFHILFFIFIVVNISGCYTSKKVIVGKTEFFGINDEFVWIKIKTGEYYFFDEFKGDFAENSNNVIGKAMLFATDSLFSARESIICDSLSEYLFLDISVNVNEITEAEVIRFDEKKTKEAKDTGVNIFGSLLKGCASAPK
ncbi:MAG: hypothetical protein HZB41_03900 [Ignavibacteriae bacterium]|nr:hypothetical protein [Ignavibacteriota bacterium]